MRRQLHDIPSFHETPPPPDASPRRYKDAPTTVVKWGYVFEWCPTHPRAHFGSTQQHRLVMECHIGRFLHNGEVVHHKNHDRTDNRLDNLELLTREQHGERHPAQKRHDPAIVEAVRRAAEDRTIPFASLGISPATLRRIRHQYGIEWNRRLDGSVQLTEQLVREALQGRTTMQAAHTLGCSPSNLYAHFGHLLSKRTKPGTLDAHCADVLHMLRHERRSQSEVATKYGVSETCVMKSVRRWMNNPEGLDLPPKQLRAIFQRWSRQDAKPGAPARPSTRHWSSKPGPKRKARDKAGLSREPRAALPAS